MASEILDVLNAIQSELKAPKGQYNSFGKYNYRSAEDILEAVKPLCQKYKAVLVLTDKPVVVGDRVYIEATVTLYLDDSQKICTTAYAREPDTKTGMDASQITGTASSYARKYALNGLFCIDDTKDADTDEYHRQTDRKPTPPADTDRKPREASDKTKAEAELAVKRFKELAEEGFITETSLNNMQAAIAKLKTEDDYRHFIANCNKNIQQAEKAKAESAETKEFKDDEIPF